MLISTQCSFRFGYALADLDEDLELAERWFAVGRGLLAILDARATGAARLRVFPRNQLAGIDLESGLSCQTLRLQRRAGEPSLVTLRYTQRQRRAMEAPAFVLEQGLEGRSVSLGDPDETYLSHIVAPIRDAQALVVANRLAVIWRLLGYLAPYRRQVAIGMAAALAITLLALVPPFLVGHLVDHVLGPVQRGEVRAADVAQAAWLAVAGIAAVYVLRQLCVWVRLRLMAVLGECVARDLRTELYAHLHRLSMSFYSRKKTGSLITRVSSDTDRLWEFLAFGVVEVSLSLVMLLGLGIILVCLDLRLGLVMTLPVPVFCYAIYRHGQTMERMFLRAWRKWSRLTDVLSDTIPGMRVVKAFNQQRREKTRFDELNRDAVGEFNRIHSAWTAFWPSLMLGVQATVIGVWLLALPRLLYADSRWGGELSLGTFVAFLLYMTMFVQPIEIIGQMARIMNRATSSAHRVFEVLDTEPEVVDHDRPVLVPELSGAVQFDNVSFAYDGVRQVLKGLSFRVDPGELIGLAGC